MVQEMDRAEQVAKKFDEVYSLANKQLTSKIERIFESYRRDHGLTEVEAQRVLDNVKNLTNIRELKQALRNTTDSEEIRQLLILLDSAPYASRIERYERLQQEVGKLSTRLYKAEKQASSEFYGEFISDAYYHSIFNLHQQAGVAFEFNKIDPAEIQEIQNMPWLGANYSQRIWGNTQQLADELQKELAVGLLTGRSSHETADAIDARFKKGKHNARRLVRTEANHFHTEMEAKAYEEADVEYYRFLATLDLRTSSICRSHDGKIYKTSERIKGKNYPPLHPWCRSDTIASDDPEWLAGRVRSARDPVTGKTIHIPGDMTYNDWYEKYVKPKYKVDNLDIWKIERANNQYEKYKSIIGEQTPKSLDEYIDLKYNDKEGYTRLKDSLRWAKAKFPSEKSFEGHFQKHRAEFPELSKEEYQKTASQLLASPIDGRIIGYDTEDGRRVRYDKTNNVIAIGQMRKNKGARLNTLLKPNDGEEYYYENYKRDFPD